MQPAALPTLPEELFDIVHAATGEPTGEVQPRSRVHAAGLFHRSVHVWLLHASSGSLLLQQRAAAKDSWPGRWDISAAGHISAGEGPLETAVREVEEVRGAGGGRRRGAGAAEGG